RHAERDARLEERLLDVEQRRERVRHLHVVTVHGDEDRHQERDSLREAHRQRGRRQFQLRRTEVDNRRGTLIAAIGSPRAAYARRIASTRAFQAPLGACTSTTSPTVAPMSADPSGESGETPPTAEISTSISLPSSSAIPTIEPTPMCSSVSCSTVTAWF